MDESTYTPPRWHRMLGNVLFIVAGALVCLAGEQVYRGMQKRASWCRVQGVMVEMKDDISGPGKVEKAYIPTFAFTDPATGRRHTVQSKLGTSLPRFRWGERVELLYPEGEPEQAVPNTLLDIYHPAIGLGVGAVVLIIFGLSLWRVRLISGPEPGEVVTDTNIRINGWPIFLPRGILSRLFHIPEARPKPKSKPTADPPDDGSGNTPAS